MGVDLFLFLSSSATSAKRCEALQDEAKYRNISTAFGRRTYDRATTSCARYLIDLAFDQEAPTLRIVSSVNSIVSLGVII